MFRLIFQKNVLAEPSPLERTLQPSSVAESVALAVACLFVSTPWAVADSRVISNVDVCVVGAPECQYAGIYPQLRATMSSRQENMMLGDLVTELARKAAQAGATILRSIRLLSITPSKGAEVAAVAGTCTDNSFGPFNTKLLRPLCEAKSARRFVFPQAGSFGPDRSVEVTEKVQGEEITGDNLERLRFQILSAIKSDAGPRKSCPFEPSTGFQFLSGDIEAWWLVSRFCETGMLVYRKDDWRRSPLVNLTPDAVRNLEQTPKE
jgi:hypothetical protein